MSGLNIDFSSVCRTCLSGSTLNPIFLDPIYHKRYTTAVFVTTGIKVVLNDGLPQKMCTNCIEQLNSSMKFRQKCRETETQLLEIQQNSKNMCSTSISDGDVKIEVPNTTRRESKIKIEGNTVDAGIDKRAEIKTEYTDYEFLDDDDDKPLKYLINTASDNDEDPKFLFVDDSAENPEKEIDENLDKPASAPPASRGAARVSCPLCQDSLSVRSLDAHMTRRHPGADQRKVKCDLCDTCVLKEKMERHKKVVHGSGRTLRCGYCKSEFDSKDVLVDHVTTCTAKKKKRKVNESGRELRECDICHKTMQKASLRMHKAVKHAGLRPVCEHCGQRFGNKFRLSEHYRAKHGYDKLKCSHCEFQTASSMALRNHERRHRGEKPFVCEACGAKFHAAYLLAQHRQSHRTEKLVKCDLCPASFKARNSLHMHKITCHSAALYRCSLCPRAYSCRHYAVKHIRHVHDYRGPVPPLQRVPNEGPAAWQKDDCKYE